MKKVLTIFLLTLTIFSLSASTVYIGGEAGITANSMIAGKGYGGYEYEAKIGPSCSLPVVVEFTSNIGLETGMSFVAKSYDYTKNVNMKGIQNPMFDYTCTNFFIEVPLAFRCSFSFGKSRWGSFFTLGGFVGYWVLGNRNGQVTGFTNAQSVDEDTDLSYYNRFEAGVSASAGVDCKFGKYDAYISFGYDLALTDLNKSQKYASFPLHNSTVTVVAGILWGVNK